MCCASLGGTFVAHPGILRLRSTTKLASTSKIKFKELAAIQAMERGKDENNKYWNESMPLFGSCNPLDDVKGPKTSERRVWSGKYPRKIAAARLDRSFCVITPLNGQVQTLEDNFTSLQCGNNSRHGH